MLSVQCVNEWAIDYLENVLLPLDNFISKGTDVFLTCQNPNFLDLTNQVGAAPGDPACGKPKSCSPLRSSLPHQQGPACLSRARLPLFDSPKRFGGTATASHPTPHTPDSFTPPTHTHTLLHQPTPK